VDDHLAPNLRIKATAVPTQHFSGRHPRDINQTLWAGWVVEFFRKDKPFKRLYFVGDTGYNPIDFKNIGKKWDYMDLSLIPIGTYLPREVNSRLSLGMHWKTFHLSDEPLHQPPYDLLIALQKDGIDPSTFLAVEPGFYINW
jgi:N-acyl-phosphatidylethanolamine-hydrolysing phospholipase D